MTDSSNNDTQATKEQFKIGISFINLTEKKDIFAPIKRRFNKNYDIECSHLVQGEPFTWGIKIKNLDVKPTPVGTISDYGIRNFDRNYFLMPGEAGSRVLPPLNPNEEIIIEIDSESAYVEGALWSYALIVPQSDEFKFETYQYNPHHKKYNYHGMDHDDNINWMESIYIQKKMELLQAKTNNYILALTIISVWESIFGIKDTIVNILINMAKLLSSLGVALNSIASKF
ncbi:hypothetical protein [Aeromonas enteropelogenes]|uniref:hypothetical protein n=1 Tax=Aeromonas enteropelogenes TaxID=29489 RepID=UPI003B9F0C42